MKKFLLFRRLTGRELRSILCALFVALVLLIPAAAQSAKSAGVKESDVKAFIKNYSAIQALLDKYDVETDDSDAMSSLSVKAAAEVESGLQKNGISGPNAINKLAAIVNCYAVGFYDKEINADPETAAMMESLGMDPIAEVRATVNAADCKVVAKYLDEITAVVQADDPPSAEDD